MRPILYLLKLILLTTCTAQNEGIKVGAERLNLYVSKLQNKKIGLYVNHTSLVNGTHLIDTLISHNIQIETVFSPEHGIRGEAADGEVIEVQENSYDFELISLYGKSRKPTLDDVSKLDLLVVDIQDVGVRFYTYISTLTYLMDACAFTEVPILLLDRPNPNGHYVDGPVLEDCCHSFVGMHPVPVVHGLTLGEFAKMINEEGWLEGKKSVDLEIIPNQNWNHQTLYTLPVKPSPNLPNDLSIQLYPSLGLFEGSVVSIGRGTNYQFQVIGHPHADSLNFTFIPIPNQGSKYPKLEGQVCFGEKFKHPELFSPSHFIKYYKMLNNKLERSFFKPYISDLIGNKTFQKQIEDGLSEEEIRASWEPKLSEYKELRKKYLLYPDS